MTNIKAQNAADTNAWIPNGNVEKVKFALPTLLQCLDCINPAFSKKSSITIIDSTGLSTVEECYHIIFPFS